MTENRTDFLIIGGGIIGVTLALEIKCRHPDQSVTILEKEKDCGLHASGRNSGVLHAGFYYSADSLKARFTRDGNRLLTEYCLEKKLPINRCGKLVVARDEHDLIGLDELLQRAETNDVELHAISEAEAKEIEPRVKTHQRALFSPTTSSIDPKCVMASLNQDAINSGIEILTDTAYLSHTGNKIKTSKGKISADFVINAAGLYADKIAHDYEFGENYKILPFKGLYLHSSEDKGMLRTHIYPVPELDKPFLGVHFTITVDGKIKIGPTAMPAFWREQYHGFSRFKPRELLSIGMRELQLFCKNDFGFRELAWKELAKQNKTKLVKLASELIEDVKIEHYKQWGHPGIRAQLLNVKTNKLEMDFKIAHDNKSLHILNAVSPAFTCALPFAKHCIEEIGI